MFEHAYILTGGIATGKSTVCSLLKLRGFEIIDADRISHESFNQNIDKIESMFATSDRKEISDIIFQNKEQRERLESLLHPLIKKTIEERSKRLDKIGYPYIVDIPLYFESKNYPKEGVRKVLVYAPKELQIQRAVNRDGSSEQEAISKIDSQMDIENKKNLADVVIDNSGDISNLQEEIERFIQIVRQDYDGIKI